MLLDSPALRPASAPCTHEPEAGGRRLFSVRKKADPEAVERRRYARRATSRRPAPPPPNRAAEDLARRTRQRRVCREMIRRFVPADRRGEPLLVDYRYWQLRRCGWDVLRGEWRQTEPPVVEASRRGGGRYQANGWYDPDRPGRSSYADPADCPVWRWWCDLHHEGRDQLVKKSRRFGMSVLDPAGDDADDGGGGPPADSVTVRIGDATAEVRCAERRI